MRDAAKLTALGTRPSDTSAVPIVAARIDAAKVTGLGTPDVPIVGARIAAAKPTGLRSARFHGAALERTWALSRSRIDAAGSVRSARFTELLGADLRVARAQRRACRPVVAVLAHERLRRDLRNVLRSAARQQPAPAKKMFARIVDRAASRGRQLALLRATRGASSATAR